MQHLEQSNLDTTILRRCTISSLCIAALLTIFHFYSVRRHWKRGELNESEILSVAVTASNLGILLLRVLASFSCWFPVVIWTLIATVYLVSRGINTLFFVYRAECVQGPNPVLSEKWFKTYIPRCLYTYYGILCIVTFYQVPTDPHMIICVSNQFSRRDLGESWSFAVWLFVGLELSITAFITFLFVVPLWRVYRAGSNANMSVQQRRSRKVLKDALKYGVLLTAINFLSSNFAAIIGDLLYGDKVVSFRHFNLFDPVINMGTTILLFKENRVSLWKMLNRIRRGLVQMCCCAFVMEIKSESCGPNSRSGEQAERNAMAIMVLNRQIANINESPNLQIVKDSITTFDDDPVDNLDFKDCS